jgi:hypothetical protein
MPGMLGTAVGQLMTTNDNPNLPLPHLRLFEQLKQRNVFRVAALYLVVCWLILEPVHVVFHMLDVPLWADRLVIMIMAVGFPAAVIFAWVYEMTPEGIKPTAEVPHTQSIRPHTGRRLDRAIIAVLAAALGWLETALKVRDPGLLGLKSELLLDPVRNEPRFIAVERAMKFPE